MQVSKPDNLFTPEFAIMKKYKDWEIRRWGLCFVTYTADVHVSL
jgi:hypothetical protein